MKLAGTTAAWRTAGAAGLLALGLAQMSADMLGLSALRGLTAATCASPAPKVFSSVKGLETFSTRFFIEWNDGVARSMELTPAAYAGVRGPYNRRNVYGAALAYGPVLASDPNTRAMFRSVARRALCGEATLLREAGIDTPPNAAVTVRLVPREGTKPDGLSMLIDPECELP